MKAFFQKSFVLGIELSSIFNKAYCQNTETIIKLINPSFEDNPTCCKTPSGWVDCGWENQTPPDIQPAFYKGEPLFGVTTKAYDGLTFLAMVARNNGTFEIVSPKLSTPLNVGTCYSFSVYLCRSKEYVSASMLDKYTKKKFNNPIKLRIYAGADSCNLEQMLNESKEIVSSEWEKHVFEFQPNKNYEFIQLVAFYLDQSKPVNGNILLDKASDIELIPCE